MALGKSPLGALFGDSFGKLHGLRSLLKPTSEPNLGWTHWVHDKSDRVASFGLGASRERGPSSDIAPLDLRLWIQVVGPRGSLHLLDLLPPFHGEQEVEVSQTLTGFWPRPMRIPHSKVVLPRLPEV